jgi:hypothetical protein
MIERRRLIVPPNLVQAIHRIAAVWRHKAIEEVVFSFQGQIEATAGKRASHGFYKGIRLVNRIALAPLNTIRNHIKGRDNFIGNKATKVTDHFLTRIMQFPCTTSPILIKLIYLYTSCHDACLPFPSPIHAQLYFLPLECLMLSPEIYLRLSTLYLLLIFLGCLFQTMILITAISGTEYHTVKR